MSLPQEKPVETNNGVLNEEDESESDSCESDSSDADDNHENQEGESDSESSEAEDNDKKRQKEGGDRRIVPKKIKEEDRGFIGKVKCDLCQRRFPSEGAKKVHLRRTHPEEANRRIKEQKEYLECGGCLAVYKSRSALQTHICNHHKELTNYLVDKLIVTRYSGTYTPDSAASTSSLRDAVSRRGNPTSSSARCHQCNKSFMNWDFLQHHNYIEHTHVRKPACHSCGEEFETYDEVKEHRDQSICGDRVPGKRRPLLNADQNQTPVREVSRKRRIDDENVVDQRGQVEQEPMRSESSNREAVRLEEETRIKELQERAKALQIKKDEKLARLLQKMFDDELLDDEDDQSNDETAVASRSKRRESLIVKKEIPATPVTKISENARGAISEVNLSVKKEIQATPLGKFSETRSIHSSKRMKMEPSVWTQDVGNRSMAAEVGSPRSQQLSDTEEKNISTVALNHVPASLITLTSTPLMIVVFNRAAESTEELLIVWSPTLNKDLLNVAKLQAKNVILCVQETNVVNLSDRAKELWNKSNKALFYMSLKGEMSHWTTISFGEQHPPRALSTIRQAFKSFEEVETVFLQHAATLAMETVHVVKYGKDGLFPILSNSFSSKMIGTNYQQ